MDIIGWLVVTQTGVIISPLRRETRASLEIMAEWLRHSDPDRDLHILAEWLRRSDPDRDLHTYIFKLQVSSVTFHYYSDGQVAG